MTGDSFIETTLQWHEAIVFLQHQNIPTQQMEVGSSSKLEEVPKAHRPDVTRIYQRGKMLVFTSQVDKRAKPSTLTKQGSHIQDEDLIEHEFELVELETINEP